MTNRHIHTLILCTAVCFIGCNSLSFSGGPPKTQVEEEIVTMLKEVKNDFGRLVEWVDPIKATVTDISVNGIEALVDVTITYRVIRDDCDEPTGFPSEGYSQFTSLAGNFCKGMKKYGEKPRPTGYTIQHHLLLKYRKFEKGWRFQGLQ